jgi:cell division protein FtsW (lipid II flippase)
MGAALRGMELSLLPFPILLLLSATALLHFARGGDWDSVSFGSAAGFAALVVAVHLVLSIRLRGADQVLLPIVATLTALGLVAVARLQPNLAPRQALWVLIGSVALIVAALFVPRVDWLGRYRYTWLVGGLALLGTTLLFGLDPNGSGMRLWLGYGGFYFQPSEVLKIVMAVFFASYLAEKRALLSHAPLRVGPMTLPPFAYLAPLLIMWALSMGLLVWQRDLGAALLFYLVFLGLLYASTGRTYVLPGLILLVVGALVAYFLFDHVQLRTRVWLDPWPYSADDGFQIVQALNAFAAGGVIGSGLGFGYPEYVPAVHTDFVLAALGEELGLIGTLGIVALYLMLVHRAFRIALRAPSDFTMLLAAGLGTILGLQGFIILAGNLRIIPITGITLPFLSYGGSSILANFMMIGLLLRISAESPSEAVSHG